MPRCIFCNEQKASREHLWGAWWQTHYPIAETQHSKRPLHEITLAGDDGQLSVGQGIFSNVGHYLSKTTKVMCKRCNNEWGSAIEDAMQRAFVSFYLEDHALSIKDVEAVRRWMLLKLCLHMRAYQIDPVRVSSLVGKPLEAVKRMRMKRYEKIWQNFRATNVVPRDYRFFYFSRRGSTTFRHFQLCTLRMS